MAVAPPINLATGDIINEVWVDAVTNSITELQGGIIARPPNVPWGQLAYSSGQGQIVTAGTVESVLMVSPVFQAVAGRKYKITADFTCFGSVNLDTFRFTLRRGATIAAPSVKVGPGWQTSTGYTPITVVGYDFTAPTGNCQIMLGVTRTAGTGTFTLVSAGTYENSISVEDVGT